MKFISLADLMNLNARNRRVGFLRGKRLMKMKVLQGKMPMIVRSHKRKRLNKSSVLKGKRSMKLRFLKENMSMTMRAKKRKRSMKSSVLKGKRSIK